MQYKIELSPSSGELSYQNETLSFTASENLENAFFEISFLFPEWEKDTYVFLPACAYNGNRFPQVEASYPPIYEEAQIGENPEPIITKIPALAPDGYICEIGRDEKRSAVFFMPPAGAKAR